MSIKVVLTLLLGVFIVSCAPRELNGDYEKVKRMRTNQLVEKIDSLSQLNFTYFYAKASTSVKDTNRTISFKTSFRLAADSAMSALIKYASIPIAQALVTTDSLIVANKREKCYIKNDVSSLRETLGIDFDFQNVQELLLGLPLDYDTEQKYHQIHEPTRYVLSSHKKRFIRRLDNDRINEPEQEIVIKYFLSPDATQLDGVEVFSASDSTSVVINYLKRQMVDSISVPEDILIEVFSPKNHMVIELTYQRVALNEPEPLYFIIPESYEACK